jgi:hypothetical protein
MIKTTLWSQFEGLLPSKRPIIGTVQSHNDDGTSTILSLDGQTVKARGTGVPVGLRAYVEEGRIMNQVPTLPSTTQFV